MESYGRVQEGTGTVYKGYWTHGNNGGPLDECPELWKHRTKLRKYRMKLETGGTDETDETDETDGMDRCRVLHRRFWKLSELVSDLEPITGLSAG